MILAIDFDGTCVTHEYPYMGKDIGSIPILLRCIEEGHKIILYTMRDGKELNDAINWFNENKIPLYGINKNPSQFKTTSPKVHADLYIDDRAVGVPLTYNSFLCTRPYVNWKEIYNYLLFNDILHSPYADSYTDLENK